MSTPATARWSTLVAELSASGQSVRAFCSTRGLNPKTLSWWRWNLSHHDAAPQFIELSVVPDRRDPAPAQEPLLIELPRANAQLHVTQSTDLKLLRRVVEALC